MYYLLHRNQVHVSALFMVIFRLIHTTHTKAELLGINLAATPEIHHVFNYDTHKVTTSGEIIYFISP